MFETDVKENEFELIEQALSEFKNPIYLEIGLYFGGTFIRALKYLKENKDNYFCYGIDLFEGNIKKRKNTHKITVNLPKEGYYKKDGISYNFTTKENMEVRIDKVDNYNYEIIQGNSKSMIKSIEKKVDVIFIDGNHHYEYEKIDFEESYKISSKNAFFIFHNIQKKNAIRCFWHKLGVYGLCKDLKKDKRVKYIKEVENTALFQRIK